MNLTDQTENDILASWQSHNF